MNLVSKKSIFPSGTNIRLLLQECKCGTSLFTDAQSVTQHLKQLLHEVGLTHLCETFYNFDKGGYTLTIILSESHVVLHTWNEHSRLVLVEISICDFTADNKKKARTFADAICKLFASQKTIREETNMIPRLSKPLTTGHGFYVDMNNLLETFQSQWQRIAVAQTEAYGKTLILDDVFQTTEKDHAFYHEPLVHVPMLYHPEPKDILICGGGDGGSAFEVLKHPSVKCCDTVEIDKEVVNISKKYLHDVHNGALEDSKVTIHIADANHFLQDHQTMYDVIIVDATNPIEDGNSLFEQKFYQSVKAKLKPNGVAGLHAGTPYIHQAEIQNVAQNIHSTFPNSYPYLAFVPSFGTVSCFYLCLPPNMERMNIQKIASTMNHRALSNLQLLTPETLEAWFTIPPNLQSVLCPSS